VIQVQIDVRNQTSAWVAFDQDNEIARGRRLEVALYESIRLAKHPVRITVNGALVENDRVLEILRRYFTNLDLSKVEQILSDTIEE
jgi:hypothetical protein